MSGAALKGPQALPSGKLTARGNRDTQVQTDKPKSICKTRYTNTQTHMHIHKRELLQEPYVTWRKLHTVQHLEEVWLASHVTITCDHDITAPGMWAHFDRPYKWTSCSVLVLCAVKSGDVRVHGCYTGHSPNSHAYKSLSPPGMHPVVVVQPKLMSAHTHHSSALQHSLDSCTDCTSGVTHLTLSHTHTGYRERGRGRGVHVAGAYSRLS